MDENDTKEETEQPSTARKDEGPNFDPSRMIGIIKRKALIKELAAAYRTECQTYCQKLLQLQKKWEEQEYAKRKATEKAGKQIMKYAKPSKRSKKGH